MARDPEITHKIMSFVKSKNTRPEIALRKSLWHRGLRFRVNDKTLPGKPDIVFTRAKIAVFCDGDYWHGHNWAIRGMRNLDEELSGYSDFWVSKIQPDSSAPEGRAPCREDGAVLDDGPAERLGHRRDKSSDAAQQGYNKSNCYNSKFHG